MELLDHPFRRCVVHDAWTEDWDHELISIALVQLRVRRAKEGRVTVGAGQQHDLLWAEPERGNSIVLMLCAFE